MYDLSGIQDRLTIAVLGGIWKDVRFDYGTGDLDYRGCNITHKAATDEETWSIWKYTYSSGNLTRIEGPLSGSWDNRASLDWA